MATRRFAVVLLSVFMAVASFAANKDLEKDITMVSYEQGWLDSEGTLALRKPRDGQSVFGNACNNLANRKKNFLAFVTICTSIEKYFFLLLWGFHRPSATGLTH